MAGGFTRKPRFVAAIFSVAMTVLGTSAVSGQTYPNRPVRIVTSEPGGASDFTARLIAQGLTASLDQPVIIDNRPAIIGAEIVSQAPPDGYTLLVGAGTFWIGPLMRKTPYDVVRDFSPITLMTTSPFIAVVHPSLPVKSVKELIALAKAKPGELNYASAAAGSPNHLAAELFKVMAGVNIMQIPYKGGGPALNALIGGEVQLMFSPAASATPHIRSGKLRALAVASAQPTALAPGVPTVTASGVPGYESALQAAMFAPAKPSAAIIKRLNQEIVRVLKRADVQEKLLSSGVEAVGSSPEELAAAVKSDMARMGKLIKDAGIRGE